jgi:predicted rRNA methylase YqxC with S4 and FtsJ domains
MRNQIKKQMKLYTQEQLERAMDLANRNVSKKSIKKILSDLKSMLVKVKSP